MSGGSPCGDLQGKSQLSRVVQRNSGYGTGAAKHQRCEPTSRHSHKTTAMMMTRQDTSNRSFALAFVRQLPDELWPLY
jgi:hypothetical protein